MSYFYVLLAIVLFNVLLQLVTLLVFGFILKSIVDKERQVKKMLYRKY